MPHTYSAVIGEIMRQYLRGEISEELAQKLVDWANEQFDNE